MLPQTDQVVDLTGFGEATAGIGNGAVQAARGPSM
jgi:hypothetical protein